MPLKTVSDAIQRIYGGDTWDGFTVNIGVPTIDLTGATVSAEIKSAPDAKPIYSFTPVVTPVDTHNITASISLTASTSATLPVGLFKCFVRLRTTNSTNTILILPIQVEGDQNYV